ncbi:hypothetical protein BASA81_005461 [Batrachochytrium salamandrivorans]|nr:hypothetical protein BASA81_005461 [Batrachochytrium salamandrivorans]
MFFLPTVLQGFQSKHLLCLSNGDFDGIGLIREKELQRAAIGVLQFDSIAFSHFRDGPEEHWDAGEVAQAVEKQVGVSKATLVVTFDQFGASGHANHISTHFGVKQYATQQNSARCLELVSDVNVLSKFSSVFGAAVGANFPNGEEEAFVNADLGVIYKAMQAHHSQFVWFRKLYLMFARGGFLNLVRPIIPPPPHVTHNGEFK